MNDRFVDGHIGDAVNETIEIVNDSSATTQTVVRRYFMVMHDNFIVWMANAAISAKSKVAREIARENFECERDDNHRAMLRKFVLGTVDLVPGSQFANGYGDIREPLAEVNKLVADPKIGGLAAVTVCAVLENTSLVFIPDLADRVKKEFDGKVFDYTVVHGPGDLPHAEAAKRALAHELMGNRDDWYKEPYKTFLQAQACVLDLLRAIYRSPQQ